MSRTSHGSNDTAGSEHQGRPESDPQLYQDLQEAYEFLTLLRVECQLQQLREGKALSNYVAPETLTHLQRSLLKEAFRASARAQSLIDGRFRTRGSPPITGRSECVTRHTCVKRNTLCQSVDVCGMTQQIWEREETAS